jgi:hypothetical protein
LEYFGVVVGQRGVTIEPHDYREFVVWHFVNARHPSPDDSGIWD